MDGFGGTWRSHVAFFNKHPSTWTSKEKVQFAVPLAVAIVGIVLPLVLTQSDSSPSKPAPSSAPASSTKVLTYDPSGLNAAATTSRYKTVSGYCWTGSSIEDSSVAWRCAAGDH